EQVEAWIYLRRFDQAAVDEDTDVIVVGIVEDATRPVVEDVELHGHARGDSQVAEAASSRPQGVEAGAAILNHERQPVRLADASWVLEQELELTLECRVRVDRRRQEGTSSLAERSRRQAQSRTDLCRVAVELQPGGAGEIAEAEVDCFRPTRVGKGRHRLA